MQGFWTSSWFFRSMAFSGFSEGVGHATHKDRLQLLAISCFVEFSRDGKDRSEPYSRSDPCYYERLPPLAIRRWLHSINTVVWHDIAEPKESARLSSNHFRSLSEARPSNPCERASTRGGSMNTPSEISICTHQDYNQILDELHEF